MGVDAFVVKAGAATGTAAADRKPPAAKDAGEAGKKPVGAGVGTTAPKPVSMLRWILP